MISQLHRHSCPLLYSPSNTRDSEYCWEHMLLNGSDLITLILTFYRFLPNIRIHLNSHARFPELLSLQLHISFLDMSYILWRAFITLHYWFKSCWSHWLHITGFTSFPFSTFNLNHMASVYNSGEQRSISGGTACQILRHMSCNSRRPHWIWFQSDSTEQESESTMGTGSQKTDK